ncbi:hypothetical protein IVB36_31100 [Bradyrhizobium sp. 35]|uniref:hypothetical protein n=1 Tax=Bradyrhizobium sp. 35 TaxID=2782670 RepID=UPI001FFB32CE|nr:hypothetical protein [Bradyrhizobium sp. 35]MCK1455203.1 hypothetical protein [Bradyrhizobium sp. 35]
MAQGQIALLGIVPIGDPAAVRCLLGSGNRFVDDCRRDPLPDLLCLLLCRCVGQNATNPYKFRTNDSRLTWSVMSEIKPFLGNFATKKKVKLLGWLHNP